MLGIGAKLRLFVLASLVLLGFTLVGNIALVGVFNIRTYPSWKITNLLKLK